MKAKQQTGSRKRQGMDLGDPQKPVVTNAGGRHPGQHPCKSHDLLLHFSEVGTVENCLLCKGLPVRLYLS